VSPLGLTAGRPGMRAVAISRGFMPAKLSGNS
jgi:hypothetical protein